MAVVDFDGAQRRICLPYVPDPAVGATGGSMLRSSSLRCRRRIRVSGLVQGVGFRPFVYATAMEFHLAGSVINDSAGVLIELEGDPAAVEEFLVRLRRRPPPLAVVDRVETSDIPVRGGTGFHIGATAAGSAGRTLASPDVATCRDCLAEMGDPADRRYRHPFITCTNCGPRFTVITSLPYDRASTTMAGFQMCPACLAEYTDPADRRFHAQPIACRECGPRLQFLVPGEPATTDEAAMAAARAALSAGRILAVKGLGGYHLVCDAGDDRAVAELRRRKKRGDKPFAVMVPDLSTAAMVADLTLEEAALLESRARPIVLLSRRADGPVRVAVSVAPGNPDLGVLLPYTPVHALLFGLPGDAPSPVVLVMTSGNMSGEPIITDDEDAVELLGPVVDGWLRHDRPIHVPCDDSVARVVDGGPQPIRRSRGYAPLPIALPVPVEAMLAVGADLKNTCCIADGGYAWMSQHIGDMDDVRSLETLGVTAGHLKMLTGVVPGLVVSDRHPGYRSTAWADRQPVHRSQVQHHHAHICSVLAEHGWGDQPVIGIAFDGTGFGSDGAVWGGEVLIARYQDFSRFAHLGYVPLPGGDAAVERPYRMALSHLTAAGVPWDQDLACVVHCPPEERRVLRHQLDTGFACVPTSSMGRLFDAVSAIAGVRQVADYEAQAAIELEGLSRNRFRLSPMAYAFGIGGTGTTGADELVVDCGPVIRAVAADALDGRPAGDIGARFHRGVVDLVVTLADRARESTGLATVALSGGVFQNALLLGASCDRLRRAGFTVLRNRRVPPNDGGLALGQLAAAGAQHVERGVPPCV